MIWSVSSAVILYVEFLARASTFYIHTHIQILSYLIRDYSYSSERKKVSLLHSALSLHQNSLVSLFFCIYYKIHQLLYSFYSWMREHSIIKFKNKHCMKWNIDLNCLRLAEKLRSERITERKIELLQENQRRKTNKHFQTLSSEKRKFRENSLLIF